MTLQEFKAWFDGFTEAMEGAPNAAQWSRIKEQVGKIDGAVTTYPVFVDRYPSWPYWSIYPQPWRYVTCGDAPVSVPSVWCDSGDNKLTFTTTTNAASAFEPVTAYYALGAAEWQASAGGAGSGV